MKDKFFLTAIYFAVIMTGLTSCSHDNDPVVLNQQHMQNKFFNYNLGNRWVYKRYENTPENPNVYTFTGITDSVIVMSVGRINQNGIPWAKLRHKKTGQEPEYEFVRITGEGRLVGFEGKYYPFGTEEIDADNPNFVYHPGDDIGFQQSVSDGSGQTTYAIAAETTINVEGKNYDVRPYLGDLSPSSNPNQHKTIEYNYQRNVGLVKKVWHDGEGIRNSYEDRLVSYNIALTILMP